MKRIGLLSDTHSFWDPKYLEYFEECDEIWHAGDNASLVMNDIRNWQNRNFELGSVLRIG